MNLEIEVLLEKPQTVDQSKGVSINPSSIYLSTLETCSKVG